MQTYGPSQHSMLQCEQASILTLSCRRPRRSRGSGEFAQGSFEQVRTAPIGIISQCYSCCTANCYMDLDTHAEEQAAKGDGNIAAPLPAGRRAGQGSDEHAQFNKLIAGGLPLTFRNQRPAETLSSRRFLLPAMASPRLLATACNTSGLVRYSSCPVAAPTSGGRKLHS